MVVTKVSSEDWLGCGVDAEGDEVCGIFVGGEVVLLGGCSCACVWVVVRGVFSRVMPQAWSVVCPPPSLMVIGGGGLSWCLERLCVYV